jgi:hypothetical protein
MSTTRSTSDRTGLPAADRAPYTVVGGARWDRMRRYPYEVTFLVLARGDRLFRADLLRALCAWGFGEVIWAEPGPASADIEQLARDFPEVRFLLAREGCSGGELINIGISEARARLVLCFWSDARPLAFTREALAGVEELGAACVLPAARNAKREAIPTWQAPSGRQRRLVPKFRPPREDGEKCLFPFDYCGLYDREKFSLLGGFDTGIGNPYWQKLDFGLRAWLWGEKILGTTRITVAYTGTPPADDTTPDEGYKKFHLRNMAIRIRRQVGVLPLWQLPEFMLRSDNGPLYAVKEFASARAWVQRHRFRFRREPRDVIERWEKG